MSVSYHVVSNSQLQAMYNRVWQEYLNQLRNGLIMFRLQYNPQLLLSWNGRLRGAEWLTQRSPGLQWLTMEYQLNHPQISMLQIQYILISFNDFPIWKHVSSSVIH